MAVREYRITRVSKWVHETTLHSMETGSVECVVEGFSLHLDADPDVFARAVARLRRPRLLCRIRHIFDVAGLAPVLQVYSGGKKYRETFCFAPIDDDVVVALRSNSIITDVQANDHVVLEGLAYLADLETNGQLGLLIKPAQSDQG